MVSLVFNSIIKIRDGNPYVHVNKERASSLKPGWRKPLPVLIRINYKPLEPWRINMMPIGNGAFYLYLHGDVRKASGTKVGDRVRVDISFDTKYHSGPMHPMPLWFKEVLDKNPKAKKNWETLIPSRKKEILRYFSWLKTPQARARNAKRALQVLSGKPSRFMARSWSRGKMCLIPFVEATEQTIFQKVVPKERLGRVFGFAHSVEQAASPLTAFLIGPIAQFVFIPFMTVGAGVKLIGGWFGTGTGWGIALVFIAAGIVGLLVTRIAKNSKYYHLLAQRYLDK